MSEVRHDRQYTQTHEWIIDNGDGTYTLGISDHAQELLGDMVFVELPGDGDIAQAGDDLCVVESVKAASDVYAPTNLEVIEINESLEDEPELINSSCYDDGWLIKFKSESVDSLMDSSAYEETLESE